MPEFTRDKPLLIDISLPSGSVNVLVEERDSVNVVVTPLGHSRQDREAAEATAVILDNDKLTIEPPKGGSYLRTSVQLNIEVQAPIDSDIRVAVASATVACKGRYKHVVIKSASGDIEIDEATGNARIQTSNGDARINKVGGKLNVKTASGNVTANDVVGVTTLSSASGNIEIADARTDVRSKSASGGLRIRAAHGGSISARSSSGEIFIGVVPDTGVWIDLDSVSGNISNDLETSESQTEAADLKIQVRTTSSDIAILRVSEKTTA
ncbi:MAG: DUF4097 family beta strand repeat protein [Chloroflexi bacterium]|jgi:DUF4097 and DUF4098 domain-containing protein YvlB|nr:DUF4097 family beta strand repeat protein [Chloroflexota bacterium]MBT5628599.1 DUF4097 family beta strand repeat protein [Chloroflexota bacterium]